MVVVVERAGAHILHLLLTGLVLLEWIVMTASLLVASASSGHGEGVFGEGDVEVVDWRVSTRLYTCGCGVDGACLLVTAQIRLFPFLVRRLFLKLEKEESKEG